MTLRKRALAIAGATMLTLMVAVTAVGAGGPLGALAGPGAADSASLTDFWSRLAANLGISQDQLNAAVKQTNLQQIDAAATAGTLTPEQAQAARDRVNSATPGTLPAGFGGKHGGTGGGHGRDGLSLDAGAAYFGITTDQLRQDLTATGSWQGVAAKYGKDNDAGKAGLKAALSKALRDSLTAKGVDAAQIDQRVAAFEQGFDQYYTQPTGGRGGRGPQAPAPSATPATR